MGNCNDVKSENKVEYLQMIQGTIDRMSTSSAIFKGFTATIVAGVSALSFSDVNKWVLILSFVPILCFAFLDVYYLQLERRYRYLYNQVRLSNHPVDFDLEAPKVTEIKMVEKKTNTRLLPCITSLSILCFYLPMAIISIVIVVMKLGGHL